MAVLDFRAKLTQKICTVWSVNHVDVHLKNCARNLMLASSRTMLSLPRKLFLRFYLKICARICTVHMEINAIVLLLDFCANNKCIPFTPYFLCNKKGSSIFVPPERLFSKLPWKSCPLSSSSLFSSLSSSSLKNNAKMPFPCHCEWTLGFL